MEEFSPWPITASSFSSRPISDWILAVIYPLDRLAIPLAETRKFQLFANLNLDFIWFSTNKLIHEAIQPISRKAIQHLKVSLEFHLSAWCDAALPSRWLPPRPGCFKGNFDAAVRGNFAVVAAVISDFFGHIVLVVTQKLHSTDVLLGKATAALFATRLASTTDFRSFDSEGDACLVILAVNQPLLFYCWQFATIISNITLGLSSFQR